VLVDTSIWIDHLRKADYRLVALLNKGEVETHPFIVGELACGTLARREEVLAMLNDLPQVEESRHHDVLASVSQHNLQGTGLNWVDAHLLHAASASGKPLWTRDPRLAQAACGLGVAGPAG
jgi:predicted nucleic acid-binding protein